MNRISASDKQIWKKYGILLCLMLGALLVWWTTSLRHCSARNEWIAESGSKASFIAEDSVITGIGLCFDDCSRNVVDQYDDYLLTGTARITDQNGTAVWEKKFDHAPIHVITIAPREDLVQSPIPLEQGTEYNLQIQDDAGADIPGITWSFYGSERNFFGNFLILTIFLLVGASILYGQYYGMLRLPFGLLWIGGLFVFACVSMAAMVPICVPDEGLHFYSAYALSSSLMEKIPGLRSCAQEVQTGILRFEGMGDRQYFYHFWSDWSYGNEIRQQASDFFLIGNMPHFSYIVSAVGITLARMIRAPYQIILVAGRLANVILYAVVSFIAIRTSPRLKKMVMAVTFLPSTLWLMNSLSYDVWNLAFILLAVSFCDFLIQKKEIRIRELMAAVLLMLVFIPIKFVYFVFLLFLLMISPGQIPKEKRRRIRIFGSVSLLAAVFIAFAARGREIILFLGEYGFDGRTDLSIGSSYSLGWAITHPVRMLLLYLRTVYAFGGKLFTDTFLGDFFADGIPLVLQLVIILLCLRLLAGAAIHTDGRQVRVTAWAIFLGEILIIMTSFVFLYSTRTEGIGNIDGLQGRYFLPLLVCLPYMLPDRQSEKSQDRRLPYLFVLASMISLMTRFSWNIH